MVSILVAIYDKNCLDVWPQTVSYIETTWRRGKRLVLVVEKRECVDPTFMADAR